MKNQPNWIQIKQALKDNFIEQDFKNYATTAFVGVDFDKGLEIFRYILEQELINHDKSKGVFEALQFYTDKTNFEKVLDSLSSKYEPFTKKIFELLNIPYTPTNNQMPPALFWCYQNLFSKQPSSIPTQRIKDFKAFTLNEKITIPNFPSTDFETNFLSDNTNFGKHLHRAYHFRNSEIHNDPNVNTNDTFDYIREYITCYLYFTFKYYDELKNAIPEDDLISLETLTIRNLASLSGGTYSPEIENEVKRDNIIQTIENNLQGLDVLFIEGEEGIGKTTILHQFVAKYPNNCFAYFIDGKDSNDYSILSILQAFCNQLHFKIKNETFEDSFEKEFYDEDFLKKYFSTNFHQLTNKRNSNQTFYFIVDGLDKISQDKQNEIKEHILDKLPYDKANIKLIFGGKKNKNFVKGDYKYDKFQIPLPSKSEALEIFGNGITSEQLDDINKICKYNAGKIVFFRDLTKNTSYSLETIIDKLSSNSNLKDFYQYLWHETEVHFREHTEVILAIIIFQDEKYDSKSIAKIINISEEEVITSLQIIPFVKKNISGKYEFIFAGFADFAEKKLGNYKNQIDKIVIDYLLRDLGSDSNSDYSFVRLVEMYKKTDNKEDLRKLLTDARWKQLLIESKKISVVSRVSSVALEAMQEESENKYIPTLLKYSVLKSALRELSKTTVWQYEIAANLVLGEYMVAENLANIAFLKEDRLKMFASIARAYKERKEEVPHNIQKNIQELYEDIDASKDFKNIKEAAVEIASLLMYSNPQLAFRLIEDLSGTISDNDNAFDWALAQISLSAHSNLEHLEDVSKEDINTEVYSKIRNPKIKELADAILYLAENQTSEEIIEKINQLESTSQKMFLIRNWIVNNQKDDYVAEIIELGLKLVVDKSDRYVPKSSDYRVFAMPLPYIKDEDKAYELIEKIEHYITTIEASSGTDDLLAIKLFITRALCNFDFEKGEKKLLDIYIEIENLSDKQQKAIKCDCLAIYANEATRIVKTHKDKNLDIYLDAAREGIENNIDEILGQTASHFEIARSIITNLVRLYPLDAIGICKKLNKSIDRNNAFLEALATYLKQDIEKVDINIVDELLVNIVELSIQKIAVSEIISRLEDINDNERERVSQFYKYFDKVDNLLDNRTKCLLYVKIISILEQNEQDFSSFYNKLNQTWNELEKSVYKIELGFEIAYHAAFLKNKGLAKNILGTAKEEKENPKLLLDSPNTTEVFSLIIELTVRVFTGLVAKNNYEQKDIDNIANIISSLPSERQQMSLWTSLILRIIPKSDEKLPRQLINSYIVPKISKITNKNERISAILENIVVLYFNDSRLLYLEELPNQKLKDIALSRICNYLFTKCLPDDVCDDNDEGYSIDHDTVEKILELTILMVNDSFIAPQIVNIRRSISSKHTRISNLKKIDIKNKFEEIANFKLPDLNNIKHSGYQLLIKANALAIQSKSEWEDWTNILQEVEKIPNLSDRIFMWDSIAELLPSNFIKEKQDLINKAINSTYELPSFLDTVERIEMIFITLYKKSITGVGLKPLLENFVKIINSNPHSPFLRENYKNILDVAHSTDPEIAKALVNSFDNDTARLNTGAYLGNHLNLLEFQTKLEKKLNPNESEQQLIESNPKFFNKIIEKKLARLNASKSAGDGLYPRDLVYQLKMASQYSIYESHNAFFYFIERLILKYENTDESKKLVRNSFLELLEVCNLIKLLSIRNADKIRSLLDVISNENGTSKIDLEIIRNQIGIEMFQTIIESLNDKISIERISKLTKIDLETIKIIANSL